MNFDILRASTLKVVGSPNQVYLAPSYASQAVIGGHQRVDISNRGKQNTYGSRPMYGNSNRVSGSRPTYPTTVGRPYFNPSNQPFVAGRFRP